jgi:hypothetical protein
VADVRIQLIRVAADASRRIRELLLAHPTPVPARGAVPEHGAYPLGAVVAQLRAEHSTLLEAVTGYPHALAYHPDTGRRDELARSLTRLMTALSETVIFFHGQTELRNRDDALWLDKKLRDVLVGATLLLSNVGPLDVDVHQYAEKLNPKADSRWRTALSKAAAYAEPVWARAAQHEHLVHMLGLQMLAISLFVVSIERDCDPRDLDPIDLTNLLCGVACDPLWKTAQVTQRWDGPSPADHTTLTAKRADRDRRVDELRTRVETTLVYAGVNVDQPGLAHHELVKAWKDLQHPAPQPSDLSISGPPYTWRPHLPEGAVRAAEYLGIDRV